MNIDFGELFNSFFQSSANGGSSGAEKHIDNVLSGVDSAVASFFNNTLTRWIQPGVYRQAMRKHLTGAEKEQNAFNAQQAQLQRDFQQSLFNQGVELENTSFQRQVNDMKQAGVNPAIMYGGAGSSGAGVPSAGSGAAASGSASAPPDISSLAQLAYIGAQIGLLKAQTGLVESETEGKEIDNINKPAYWQRYLELLGNNSRQAAANADKLLQEKETETFRTAAAKANVTTVELENDLLVWRNLMAEMDASMYQDFLDVNLRLANSTADLTDEQIEVARKQAAELLARSILERAEAKQLDAETWRLLKENEIIEDNNETFEQFVKSGWNITITDNGTRKLQNVMGVIGQAVGSITSTAGIFMLGKSLMSPKIGKVGYKH